MSYIKKSLPKVASLGLASMMLLSAMPLNQASASELQTPNAVTQEVAKQALQGYLGDSQGTLIQHATAEELKLPFAPELYHLRDELSPAGKQVWDFALKELLEFDPNKEYADFKHSNKLNENNYRLTLDVKGAGIEATAEDVKKLNSYFVRSDPRMFLIKDWGQEYKLDANGKVETISYYIPAIYAETNAYQERLAEIEKGVANILSVVDSRMTVPQKVVALHTKFKENIGYAAEGEMHNLIGAFISKKAVCGGYSKGFQYLAMRAGIKTIWLTGHAGGPHAWNKVEVDGKWYVVDSTWGWTLRGKSSLNSHNEHQNQYESMPETAQESYDVELTKWLAPEKYEETSQAAFKQIEAAVTRALNKVPLGIADIGTIKTGLPVGSLHNNSGNFFAGWLVSEIKNELNKLKISGKVDITIDNSARRGNAQAVVKNGLTIKHQALTTTPEYQYVNGVISQVQPEFVEEPEVVAPEVVEKTGEQIAQETYDATVSTLKTILTKHQANLSQVDDIMVISPKEFDYVGKTEVEQQIADELAKELEGKFKGRLAVMISGNASYTTPEDFINNGLLVGFQSEVDGKYYQFTKGGQVSVYGE